MKAQLLIASAFVTTFAVPLAAHAQGVPGGIAHGIYLSRVSQLSVPHPKLVRERFPETR
jgi:hypothetical protein